MQAMATLVVTGIDVAATAINISMKDFQYVARSYVLTFMATGAYFAACRCALIQTVHVYCVNVGWYMQEGTRAL